MENVLAVSTYEQPFEQHDEESYLPRFNLFKRQDLKPAISDGIMAKVLSLVLLLLVTANCVALDCPDGWEEFDNSCYKVLGKYERSSRFNWVKALRVCLGYGGNLLSIANDKEMEFVNNLSSLQNNRAWIGLIYWFKKGGYLWSDGTPFNHSVYVNWLDEDKPKNRGKILCVERARNGTWNLTKCLCTENPNYICKRPKGPLACPVGWFLNRLSCYKRSDKSDTWAEAHQSCSASGSYLVKIEDDDEQRFMFQYVVLTGLNEGVDHVWIDQKREEKCVLTKTDYTGVKVEEDCGKLNYYICKKPAPGYSCYQFQSNKSSAGYTVNCTFPENLCFKHSNKTGNDKQVTIQGCMSAEQCRQIKDERLECCGGDLCNKEISCYHCSSNKSFDDCIKNEAKVDCPIPVHQCAKLKYTTKEGKLESTYQKRCITNEQCKESNTRTVDCCSEDLCNEDRGPRCYECASTVTLEECHDRQCIFNDGQCYSASKQESSSAEKRFKYGCIEQRLCNKTDVDGYFVQCCDKSLCNEVFKPTIASTGTVNKRAQDDSTQSPINAVVYISFGVAFILLLFLSAAIGFWCYRKSRHKQMKRLGHSHREIIPLDKWEILPEQLEYEEKLGQGAFGVVHKAILKRRAGLEVFYTGNQVIKLPKKASQVVAVKELKDDVNESQIEAFMFEIEQMKLLGFHPNIVSMVGCCTLWEQKSLVIEYVPFGDLLQWLRQRRKLINQPQVSEGKRCYEDKDLLVDGGGANKFDQEPVKEVQTPEKMESTSLQDVGVKVVVDLASSYENLAASKNHTEDEKVLDQRKLSVPSKPQGNRHTPAKFPSTESLEEMSDDENEDIFTTQQLFSFAWQITKGMNHLAENNFVHRDLAARNVLVGSDNRVKVSDFGLMRQIYEDVYTSEKTKKLPVKWMAPESLYHGTFTIKSDVWAFGVLLWEMATLGGVPYPTFSNTELFQLLKTGYRMERPDMCSDEVYELITECWREDPSTRPSFFQLIEKLEVLLEGDVEYFDLNKYDESSPYYNVPLEASSAVTAL